MSFDAGGVIVRNLEHEQFQPRVSTLFPSLQPSEFGPSLSSDSKSNANAMSSLISWALHPLISLSLSSNDDDDDHTGIDVVYPLTAFFALGIWLVFRRYQNANNSAVPFTMDPPAVCLHLR